MDFDTAIDCNDQETIKNMLETEIDSCIATVETLDMLISRENIELISLLLKYDFKFPEEVIINSVLTENIELVSLLLDKSNHIKYIKEKCLTKACTTGYLELVECIVSKGADLYYNNCRPIYKAIEFGHDDLIYYFSLKDKQHYECYSKWGKNCVYCRN